MLLCKGVGGCTGTWGVGVRAGVGVGARGGMSVWGVHGQGGMRTGAEGDRSGPFVHTLPPIGRLLVAERKHASARGAEEMARQWPNKGPKRLSFGRRGVRSSRCPFSVAGL